jgi:hypothetical protein
MKINKKNDDDLVIESITHPAEYYEVGKPKPTNPNVRPVAIDCNDMATKLKEGSSLEGSPSTNALRLTNNLFESINRGEADPLDSFVSNMGDNLSELEKKVLKSTLTNDFNDLQKVSTKDRSMYKNVKNIVLGNTDLYKQKFAKLIDHIASGGYIQKTNIMDNQSFPSIGQLVDEFKLNLQTKLQEKLNNSNSRRSSVESALKKSNVTSVSEEERKTSSPITVARSLNSNNSIGSR